MIWLWAHLFDWDIKFKLNELEWAAVFYMVKSASNCLFFFWLILRKAVNSRFNSPEIEKWFSKITILFAARVFCLSVYILTISNPVDLRQSKCVFLCTLILIDVWSLKYNQHIEKKRKCLKIVRKKIRPLGV